jgi:hypothetical protein
MLSRKKIAAVTGLLGGIALTCAGVVQAYGDTKDECTRDAQGNVSCVRVQKSETVYRTEDGTVHIRQSQNCSTNSRSRVVRNNSGSGQPQVTRVGPRVGCNVSTSAPKGFVAPHIALR